MPKSNNLAQNEAIHFTEGALQLLAGPGSGKTYVITHRIQFLVEAYGISPDKILVITFTKAAAMEMKERFLSLVHQDYNEVNFGTFHAIFFQILKSSKEYRNVTLISETNRIKLIKQILANIPKEIHTVEPDITGVIKQLSKYKNDLYAKYDCMEDVLSVEAFQKFQQEYEEQLQTLGVIDFDDMVLLCYRILLQEKELLSYWQNRFAYLLIDEFQDINPMQYEVVKLLCQNHNNLFVVGDDDQSIYGFRGAKPQIMKQFLEEIPRAKQLCMGINYRSYQNIVACAKLVIQENKNRFPKNILANHAEKGEVCLKIIPSSEEENTMLLEDLKHLHIHGVEYHQIAILLRTNRELYRVASFMNLHKIPIVGNYNQRNLLDKSYIVDFITYLKIVGGDYQRDFFYRIMNKPVRYIKRAAITDSIVQENALLTYYRGNYHMIDMIQRFFSQLHKMETMKPYLCIHYLRYVVGYEKYAKENFTKELYAEYLEDIESLSFLAKEYQNLATFLEELASLSKQADQQEKKQDLEKKEGICLYTYHGSKGLEFDYVILPGLVDGMVPPKQARTLDMLEEERRMFYVAMTRAKKGLYLYAVENEKDKPSRFIQCFRKEKNVCSSIHFS